MTPAPALAILEGANQPRSEYQMPIPINLSQGHHALNEPAEDWKAEFVEGTVHSVKLTVAIRSFPAVPLFGPTGRPATTLAIQMDQAAAMRLFWQIRELARSMGWQLPPEGERPT